MIDLGGVKYKSKESFAVVVLSSDKKINNREDLKNMKEYFYKGKYLYIDKKFNKKRKAELYLDLIKTAYPNAFVIGYGLDYDGLGRQYADIYQTI